MSDFSKTAASLKKPAKGSARRARIEQRLKLEAREAQEKRAARRRDGRCRWPHQTAEERELCRRTRCDVHHVHAKGMSGDRTGVRSTADVLIYVDADVHEGPLSFHQKNRRVVYLTPRKCNGPIAFEEKRGGRWMQIAEEVSVGVLRHATR